MVKVDVAKQELFSGTMDIVEMDEALELYRDLFGLTREGLKPAGKLRRPGEDEIKMRISEGFTILESEDIMPSKRTLARKVREVADALARHSEENREGVNRSLQALWEFDGLPGLALVYLKDGEEKVREEIARNDSLDPEVTLFVIFNALKGSFLETGSLFRDVETDQWDHSLCPVCGGLPALARMEGDGGQRYLTCHRCETSWRFGRIICPFCGNNDHKQLGYFTLEEDDQSIRVDFCNLCMGYIKTWDLRDQDERCPEMEDLKTARYDLAAEGEGFSRGGPNVFGVWVGFQREAGEETGEPGEKA